MVNERNGECQRIAFSSARKKSTISCLSNTSSVATYGGPRYPFWSLCSIKPDGNDGAHADVGAAPMETSRAGKFEADVEVGVLHGSRSGQERVHSQRMSVEDRSDQRDER